MSTHTLVARPELTLPTVNLLPPEIAEAARARHAKMVMAAVLAVAVLAVGGLYVQAHGSVATANADLQQAELAQGRLQTQVSSFREVTQIDALVAARQALLSSAMGQEIQWSSYLNDLSLKIPANVWLTAVSATEGSSSGTSGPSPAGATGTVGSVSFTGTAMTHNDVATWLEALATEPGFTEPYFSNSTEATVGTKPVVNFTSMVQLTPAALSGRYTQQAGG